ncbi:uncharacterized protein [Nicotiana tomentosiformis]|uniref:uncharacterized protein n=1 Tax=Nicotiana tomentosiformis TaxID=4098 RepID=UPI00388CE87F
MSDKEEKRLERLGRLKPQEFSGAESEDAKDFLDSCLRMLHTTGLLDTSGVAFTRFMLTGVAYRWDASILFNPGSTHSYVSSHFAHYLDMPRDSLVTHAHVSTLVGDYIIVDHVYRLCVVTIGGYDTKVDLLPLSMIDFDVILGIDWLSPCHALLDCHAKTVMLVITGVTRFERRGSMDYVPIRVISYLKAQWMVEKGSLAYLVFVRDVSVDNPTTESAPVVRDFPYVFPADLSGMPPDRDIDFGIDLIPGTQPISISPYRMALIELKKLKEQL